MIQDLISVLENFAKLGINISEKSLIKLKWRLSEEGQKYYTKKENIKFYKALSKGNTKVIDLIRKEKQQKINDLLKKTIPLLFCCFLISCNMVGKPLPLLDESSLKEIEKSHQLKSQEIETYSGIKKIDNNWYMVYKDFIVTFNENQNNLIKILQQNSKLQTNNNKAQNKIHTYYIISIIFGGIILIFMLIVLILFIIKKKKNEFNNKSK